MEENGNSRKETSASCAPALDPAPRIYACFWVEGPQFDLRELDAMFGIRARSPWRAGDRWRGGKRGVSSWHHSTAEEVGVDWPAHLHELLDMVEAHADELRQFCIREQAEFGFHMVASMSGATPIGSLDSETIRRLADLGSSLDIDLYCDGEGPTDVL